MKVKEVKEKIKNIDELCSNLSGVQKACYEHESICEDIRLYSFSKRIDDVEAVLVDTIAQLLDYKHILEKAIDEAEVNL